MDNLTHTLFGATLGRAAFARGGRGTTAALLLASNAPDTDIVTAAGGSLDYLAWHRGPTHGPLGVIGLSLVTAGLVWSWQRTADRRRRDEHAPFVTLLLASAAGLVAHILMDVPTSYGTRWLSPFDWHWYAADLMPIIDIYLLLVLAAGLGLGRLWAGQRRALAVAALAYMALNYGVRAASHQWTLARVPAELAGRLPAPCPDAVAPSLLDRWPRDDRRAGGAPRDAAEDRRAQGASHCLREVALVPTFLSPFHWQVIADLSDGYETLDVDLWSPRDAQDRGAAAAPAPTWVPDQWTPAVVRAADTHLGRVFLDFARFPASRSVLHADRSATVTWTDLRFANLPGRRPARTNLFVARVALDPDGQVVEERLGE